MGDADSRKAHCACSVFHFIKKKKEIKLFVALAKEIVLVDAHVILLGSNVPLCVRLAEGFLAPIVMKVQTIMRTMMKMLIDVMQFPSAKVFIFLFSLYSY